MSISTLHENGLQVIADRVLEDIARISASKIKGVFAPKKESDFINCTIKDDKISVLVTVRLMTGVDVVKTCTKLQNSVKEAIADSTNIECDSVNVEVQSFVTSD